MSLMGTHTHTHTEKPGSRLSPGPDFLLYRSNWITEKDSTYKTINKANYSAY